MARIRVTPEPIQPTPKRRRQPKTEPMPDPVGPSDPSYALPKSWRPQVANDAEEAASWWPITKLDFWDDNPRHNDDTAPLVRDLIKLYGFGSPMVAWPDPARGDRLRLIIGNTRKKGVHLLIQEYMTLTADDPRLGDWHPGALRIGRTGLVPVRIRSDLTEQQATDLALADNKSNELSAWDHGILARLMASRDKAALLRLGWSSVELSRLLSHQATGIEVERASVTLAERFTVPPFTTLDARQGYWRDRKRAWIDLGLKSHLGREGTVKTAYLTSSMLGYRKPKRNQTDAELLTNLSIFDPVLAELAYRWFCPPAGLVLDPFAGGSVRGLVAQRLGLRYYGIDLRPEHVEANRYQADKIGHRFHQPGGQAQWVAGEAAAFLATQQGPTQVDMVFGCPPYMDLEVYSEDPRDLSNLDPTQFWEQYRAIIARVCARLANHRFVVWVVGEVRDSRQDSGVYRGFVPGTIQAFKDAGLSFYNEAILLTSLNSVPLRAAKHFTASRKLCRTHQNVLVFLKGKWRDAVLACGDVSHCVPEDLGKYLDGDPDEND